MLNRYLHLRIARFVAVGTLFLSIFVSCSPSSLEDYQQEGEAICRQLHHDLKNIETREDLVLAIPRLKKKFASLVDVMIEARNFQENYPEEKQEVCLSSIRINQVLQEELKRIYHIEGGQELIEKAERESLIRLDAFEKKLSQQKQSLKYGRKNH